MSKIICELENASTEINGIKFGQIDGVEGLVSEEVNESIAAVFLSIPGYVLYGPESSASDTTKLDPEPLPSAPIESAAQRKARLKAEEKATPKEDETKEKALGSDDGESQGEGDNNEVF